MWIKHNPRFDPILLSLTVLVKLFLTDFLKLRVLRFVYTLPLNGTHGIKGFPAGMSYYPRGNYNNRVLKN